MYLLLETIEHEMVPAFNLIAFNFYNLIRRYHILYIGRHGLTNRLSIALLLSVLSILFKSGEKFHTINVSTTLIMTSRKRIMDLICSLLFIPITVVYNFTRKCNKYRCTLSFNTIRPNSSIMLLQSLSKWLVLNQYHPFYVFIYTIETIKDFIHFVNRNTYTIIFNTNRHTIV